jgi:glycosyltransferase involved in cell wall biosynthesis
MNSHPRISILTPVYNAGKYLAETLDSIVKQTFQDWEVILMDGASKDGTLAIARDYAARFPNIKVFSAPDEGPLDAFHKALPHARGDYINMVCASDGFFESRWLEWCVDAFDCDSEISVVWGIPVDVTEDGRVVGPHFAFAHFMENSGSRSVFFKEIWRRLVNPRALVKSLTKLNVSHLKTARDVLAEKGPPQKEDWFPYWLETGTIFPDGNMCVAKKVFTECLPPYRKGTRDTGDWAQFYFDINAKGYLAWCIPVPANFSRNNQQGSVTSRVQTYNDMLRKRYYEKLAAFRREVKEHPEKVVFRDRMGRSIGGREEIKKRDRSYAK